MTFHPPSQHCVLCSRLVAFRDENKHLHPTFYNGAVPAFGDLSAKLLVVGLAPGLKGANATGRPFTGDYAGDVLYESLLKCNLASGDYQKHKNDGLTLHDVRITNAVRCVPPENKPVGEEIKQCNTFLADEIAAMPNLKVILSLGSISHNAVLKARSIKQSKYKFAHAVEHDLGKITLLNSYHCSRYNINTNRLTQAMFDAVMQRAKSLIT